MTTTTDAPTVLAAEAEKRSAYAAGLRALADLLDAHPEVPLPYDGSDPTAGRITFHFLSGDNPRGDLVTALRAFPGQKAKNVWDSYFDVQGSLHGLHYRMSAFRDAVCERVVTGTREVTEEVPDPEALAAVPTVMVTKTVEDVRWDCKPLLADQSVPA